MLIRENEKKQKSMKFQGSIEDYQEPDMLLTSMKWIIAGLKTTLNSHNQANLFRHKL